ncbi:methyl-accepting chemotaxis protein [Psychromonas sp.]|nr:methyl-accepting chemotaxis protein [Psychromonas sp.]
MTAKIKILLLIGLLISSAIFIVSGVGFVNFKSASTENNMDNIEDQAFLISKAVDQKMNRYFDALNFAAQDIAIDENGLTDAEKTVITLGLLTKQLGVLDAYITTKDAKTYSYDFKGIIPNFSALDKKREWFLRTINGEKNIITTPFKSSSGNDVMALATPIVRNGNIVGVLCLNLNVNQITDFINELNPDNQLFVSRADGYLLAAKSKDLIGQNLYELRPSYKKFQNDSTSHHDYEFDGERYTVASNQIDTFGWTVWAWNSLNNINQASNANLQISLLIAIVFIIISLYVVYLIIMKVMYLPIGGEPTDIESIVQTIAQGNLRAVPVATGKETGVYKALLTMVVSLKGIIESINTSTQQLSTSSVSMSKAATSVNQSSEKQMMQLEQTSTAMNEMTVTVEEVARNALQASTAADQANSHSNQGISVVNIMNNDISTLVKGITDVQKVMDKLEGEIENIGNIIEVIRGISDQTNLLALNAAIEAARAGEFGRGFSVVADEVRSLANRTQESTAEIQSMINSLQSESKNSVQLMQVNVNNAESTAKKSQEANVALEEIQRSISIIQDMNNQIATSAEEQTLVAGEINESIVEINDIAKVTFDNSANNSKTAEELLDIATALNKRVEIFKL